MKKFNIFLKNFWKFSKSKNRNFLKIFFGQKNYFAVLLRPNYIDLHSFLTQNGKKKFEFFGLRIFSKNQKKIVSKFCGARPHKLLTLMNWNSIYFFGLSPEVLWKTEWTEKKLNCTMLSPNSVPEGHCQITIKCTQ